MATAKKTVKNNQDENEFSFRELLIKSLNYVPLFIVFLILSLASAMVYIHYQTPVYSTTVKLLLKDLTSRSGNGQVSGISDQVLPQVYFTPKTTMANETEVLRSQGLMERVVKLQQLNTLYYSIGKVNTIELFDTNPDSKFIRFTAIRDSSRSHTVTIKVKKDGIYVVNGEQEVKTPNHKLVVTPMYDYMINVADPSAYKPDYKYSAIWTPTPAMAGRLAGSLGISPLSKDASILVISTASQVPRRNEVVLNTLVNEYYNYNIEQTNKIADNTIQFIDDRLLVISGELDVVETGLKNFRQENALDIAAKGAQQEGITVELQNKLADQELQVNIADMVSQYINNPQRRYELVPSNLGIGDATLGSLVSGYNEGVLKRNEMLKTLGEENLTVRALEEELDGYRNKIIESINNIKAVYRDTYNDTYRRYQSAVNTLHGIPEKEKQLLEIERQQGIKEKLYLYLLQKREESAISRAAAIGKSASVDQAKSSGPINLKNSNVYMLALFAGLGIPLLIVYLMDLLNDRVTTRDEILKFTEVPIIGEITHFEGKERKIVSGKTRGILPEQFRIVRTNLRYFLQKDRPGTSILVTSTMPGEGKTFFSINLAAVLAVSGKKTVLIEFDMRRPKVSEAIKVSKEEADLTAFLSGETQPEKVIRPVEGAGNLYAITTSFLPPNPAELLLSEHTNTLFSYLKKHFDYIIIDTPPVGVVSDARVLSEYADMSIYIVRQRFTQRKQLKMLDILYQEKKLPNLAMVVNDVKLKGIRSYYGYGYTYGGSYSYDYSMGYGYANGHGKKKTVWQKVFRGNKH
ncbi:MAG TPA: polysaccharide biosynthesis tyrosine autokinase [Parafilimonas sp.]|nr:polysaccharide biosynthesis tyrosine autokinase [Parafilimonas sp.]